MRTSSRIRRVVAASALALAVGGLAACTPKPGTTPPPAPAPPAPPPPSAHLTVTPASDSLSLEATYVVNDTHAFTVKNDGQATSEPVAIDLSGLTNAYINWVVPMDFCTGKTLAVGDTCTFLLEPHPLKYWPATTGPADLAVTAGAGVSATASITGHLTSDLKVAASNVPLVFSASAAGGGSDTMVFHIDNVSGHAVGPLNYSVTGSVGGTGMWALNTTGLGTPCQAGVSLAAGTGCDLNLVYTNNTGAGSSTGVVSIDGDDGAHASGAGIGFGTA